MLSYPAATAALLLLLGSEGDAAATPKQRMAFMAAMNDHKGSKGRKGRQLRQKLSQKNQKDFMAVLYGNSKKSAALREKVKAKATVKKAPGGPERKLQNNYNYNGNNANGYNGNNANGNNANAYQANNNYNGGSNYNSANNANSANGNSANANSATTNSANAYGADENTGKSGTDDYFMNYGEWENEFGFDYSQFSLSYHRCAAVSQYDDEIAATEDTSSVFATKNFAVFRFCPEATCMGFESEDWCDDETLGADYCAVQREKAEFGERVWNEQYEMYSEECDAEAYGDNYCAMVERQKEWEKVQVEEQVLYGARGEGCQENYGEYMIELEEYLSLMLEYQMERFENYCEYCETCMYNVYQVWLENGGFQDDDAANNVDDYNNDDVYNDDENENASSQIYYQVCPEYNTCSSYKTLCEEELDETYTQYFECTELESNNGQVAYIGPHCAEDGFTVTLGVYSDEYCNQYIGNGVDISNFIGQEVDVEDDALKPWYNSANGALEVLQYSNEDNVCIPCNKADLPYEESEYVDQYTAEDADDGQYQYQQEQDDTYEDNRQYKVQELNEICENLYIISARCDKHFRSYNSRSKMAKYREAMAQEDLSCDFIDSIVMGNYNEMGFVNLEDTDGQSGWLKNNMYAQEYGHYVTEVSPLQVFGLVASLCACALLAVWSMTLHKSMSKKGPWRPTRGVRNAAAPGNAQDLGRQDSGIMLGRSRTDASYYMS